jgi:lipid A disaccharide synthetase
MARRFNIEAIAYKWANRTWDSYFIKYLVPQKKFKDIMLRHAIVEEKIEVIGEFVADAVLDELKDEKEYKDTVSGHPVICFMPGSRSHELKCLLKFFMKTAELISMELPSASFILSLSPFISIDVFLDILSSPVAAGFTGSDAKFLAEGNYLETSSGVRVLLYQGGTGAIAKSDFVIKIPGTKSSEAAVLGKPMMVITPMNRPI